MPTSTIWRHARNPESLRVLSPTRPSAHEIEPLSPTPFLELSLPDSQPTLTQENGHTLRGLGLSDVGISDAAAIVIQPDHLYLDQNGAAHVGARESTLDSAAPQPLLFFDSPVPSSRTTQNARGKGHTRSGSTIADLANAAIATSPAVANSSPFSHWKGASQSASRPSTSYIHRYSHQDSIDGPPAKRIKSERIAPQEWSPNGERPRTSGYDDSTTMKDALLLLSLRNETNFKNSAQRRASTSTYTSNHPAALSPPIRAWDAENCFPPQGLSGLGTVSLEISDDTVSGAQDHDVSTAQSQVSVVHNEIPEPLNGEPSKRKHSRASETVSKHLQPARRRTAAPGPGSPPAKKLKLEQEDPEDDVRCAACQRIEPDRVDDDERTLWIQCGPCKRWYHAQCAGYSTKADVEAVNAYVCMSCEPVHGKTTYVRKSSRARPNIDYDALNQGLVKSSIETSTHHYIQPFKEGKFALLPDDFARVRPELLTVELMQNFNGMKRPFVVPAAWNPRFGVQAPITEAETNHRTESDDTAMHIACDVRGNVVKDSMTDAPDAPDMLTEEVVDCGQDLLDMVIPRNLTVRRVAELYGPDEPVPVIDVKTQETKGQFTLQQWADYYEQPGDKPIRNVISLEVSQSPLGKLIRRPKVVRDLDLEDHVWDTDIEARTKKRPVQFYCLMSVADSYTDFHIDFGGSSVYYHILKGTKTFFFIPPEDKYLKKYENWCNSDTQNETWLGKECENNCIRVDLHEGDTAFIPAGWIHSVWTPEDSLVIGGNFLTRIDYEMQLKVANIERLTKVAAKFRYPYFQKVMWYALIKYLEEDPMPDELLEDFREDPGYVYLRANCIWHEVQDLENMAEPGSPEYNARFYPKSEASGWPALRDYVYRTARIDAGLPVSDITKKQVDAVKASIPKGHGNPLTMVKVFAIWCAWKVGNVPAPDWVHSDGALEADKVDKIKKPETFRLPGERSSSRRAAQAQNQVRNSPAPESSVSTPKQTSRSVSKGSGLRVACEPCRKRRIKCRHKAGSDTPTRAAPEIRPRSFSNTDVPPPEISQTNGTSGDQISSPEVRYSEVVGGADTGPPSLPAAEPGSSSSKKSRSKACEECRKSKRRCVHDEHGRVDPAKAAEPAKPRGSTNSKRPARLSDENTQIKHDLGTLDDLIDPALMNGNDVDVEMQDEAVEDYYALEHHDEIQSRLSREDTKLSETEAANLQLTNELDAEQFPIDPALETATAVQVKPELDLIEHSNIEASGTIDAVSTSLANGDVSTPAATKAQNSMVNGDFSGPSATPGSRHSSRQPKAIERFSPEYIKSPSKVYAKSPADDRRGSSAASGQTVIMSGKSRRSSSNTSGTIHQLAGMPARRSASVEGSGRPVSRGSTGAESDLDADEKFARELQAAENGLRRRTSMRA